MDRAFNHHLLQWLQFHQSILIGELISLALRYIRQNPACDVRRDYDHVIVDEYQDLNKAEQTVLDLISENASTAIVGDVNQSIYSFRHANPEGILEYSATHNPTHDESLEQCRRCPERIVHMADSLIKYNHPGRVDAILEPLPERDTRSDVAIVQWQSVQEEIAGIASYIADLVGRLGVAPGDIMVLSPRKQLGYALGTALEGLQIPVHSFYNEEPLEERDSQIALTKLLLSGNHEDRVALRFWLGAASPNFLVNQYATLRTHCEQTGQSPWQTLENIANGTLTLGRDWPFVSEISGASR